MNELGSEIENNDKQTIKLAERCGFYSSKCSIIFFQYKIIQEKKVEPN